MSYKYPKALAIHEPSGDVGAMRPAYAGGAQEREQSEPRLASDTSYIPGSSRDPRTVRRRGSDEDCLCWFGPGEQAENECLEGNLKNPKEKWAYSIPEYIYAHLYF